MTPLLSFPPLLVFPAEAGIQVRVINAIMADWALNRNQRFVMNDVQTQRRWLSHFVLGPRLREGDKLGCPTPWGEISKDVKRQGI